MAYSGENNRVYISHKLNQVFRTPFEQYDPFFSIGTNVHIALRHLSCVPTLLDYGTDWQVLQLVDVDPGAKHIDHWGAIAAAIDSIHAEGYLHNDLHMGNILIDKQGKVWIIDFDYAEPCSDPNRFESELLVAKIVAENQAKYG